MTPAAITGIAVAVVMVLGMIGSVILLAFKVGALSGTISATVNQLTAYAAENRQLIADLTQRFNHHVESHGGTQP